MKCVYANNAKRELRAAGRLRGDRTATPGPEKNNAPLPWFGNGASCVVTPTGLEPVFQP